MPASHFLHALESRAADTTLRLTIAGAGATLATSIEFAGDSETRRRGLLGREALAHDIALIIAPCSAVHTFGMKFSIDVIFAARDGRVLKIASRVPPQRIAAAWRAFAAIEMAAGEAGRHGLRVGDVLTLT